MAKEKSPKEKAPKEKSPKKAANKKPNVFKRIGNYFREGPLLAFADRFQQVTDWHQRQPGQQ